MDYTVAPFHLIVDTREQHPWRFERINMSGRHIVVPLVTDQALKTGDYSIEGQEARISIERKSYPDLMGSLTQDRERFEREMVRLNELEWSAVIVESGWTEILATDPQRPGLSKRSIYRTILSWSIRYPTVHWFTSRDRSHAEAQCFHLLRFWHERQEETQSDDTAQDGRVSCEAGGSEGDQ
jgi:DNA excision repair protein ERCC-4